jgi:RhoGEF domain
LLAEPYKRIAQYSLLVRELLKRTPSEHHDYANLVKSYDMLQSVAAKVELSMAAADTLPKVGVNIFVPINFPALTLHTLTLFRVAIAASTHSLCALFVSPSRIHSIFSFSFSSHSLLNLTGRYL